ELPEGAAEGIEPGSGHVDRAEPAMGGIVRGAELLRPPAGQGLALVTAGEEGELARVAGTDSTKPVRGGRHRLFPGDLLEPSSAARTYPQQRGGEAGGRVLIHDPRGALAAEHPLVHGVVGIALDVADPPILQMHPDPAAAGAHVAGRRLDLVGY